MGRWCSLRIPGRRANNRVSFVGLLFSSFPSPPSSSSLGMSSGSKGRADDVVFTFAMRFVEAMVAGR